MMCPCNGCDERTIGCHSNCPKTPSYDDWKQWSDERSKIDKAINKDRCDYLRGLVYSTQIKRRKW